MIIRWMQASMRPNYPNLAMTECFSAETKLVQEKSKKRRRLVCCSWETYKTALWFIYAASCDFGIHQIEVGWFWFSIPNDICYNSLSTGTSFLNLCFTNSTSSTRCQFLVGVWKWKWECNIIPQCWIFYISLLVASLDLLFSILQAYIEGFNLIIEFSTVFVRTLNDFTASSCIIIFLLSVLIVGLDMALWNLAALGLLLAWFSVGFSLQVIHFSNIGVYVTMLMSTLRLIGIVTVYVPFGFCFCLLHVVEFSSWTSVWNYWS